jgi:hypothetical protein
VGWQIIAKSTDGRRRLWTTYENAFEANREAERMHRCSSAAVRDNGGEWFNATYYEVVPAIERPDSHYRQHLLDFDMEEWDIDRVIGEEGITHKQLYEREREENDFPEIDDG